MFNCHLYHAKWVYPENSLYLKSITEFIVNFLCQYLIFLVCCYVWTGLEIIWPIYFAITYTNITCLTLQDFVMQLELLDASIVYESSILPLCGSLMTSVVILSVAVCKLAHLPMTQLWHTDSTPTWMALTYANEVEAVPVSSSRFHTIKALCISHTTIIDTTDSNRTQHSTTRLKIEHSMMSEYCINHAVDKIKK